MRLFRPLAATAVAVGALGGGAALVLSLTGASAASASSVTTHTTRSSADVTAARPSTPARPAPSGSPGTAAPRTAMMNGKCAHMSGSSRASS